MKRLLPLLALLLLCRLAPAQMLPELVRGRHYQGVIFPASLRLEPNNPADTVRRWTPTAADIATLEQELPGFLKRRQHGSQDSVTALGPSIRLQLARYKRQYAGFISPEGEKIIFVNCFYSDAEADRHFQSWTTRLVQVFDGGSYYWRVYYNPRRHRFMSLRINGVA